MSPEIHTHPATFIWSICNLLRGRYQRGKYRKVILLLTEPRLGPRPPAAGGARISRGR